MVRAAALTLIALSACNQTPADSYDAERTISNLTLRLEEAERKQGELAARLDALDDKVARRPVAAPEPSRPRAMLLGAGRDPIPQPSMEACEVARQTVAAQRAARRPENGVTVIESPLTCAPAG